MSKRPDAESLLQIPLVRAAFTHPVLTFRPRAVDLRWHYERIVDRALTGFVPLSTDLFYGRHSRTATWLRHPGRSARLLNAGDHLVSEVLFAVHDFLHAWALLAIADLVPELDARPTRGGARRLEDLAFVHLATETAATIGLDYWYLATREPHEICDIGTLKMPLTTTYHERHVGEYRRFRPDLAVQDPAFFGELARFYCDGRLVGFSAADLARSPRLSRWLEHEVRYGQRQREYTRWWLAFVSGHASDEPPGRPVACDARWQKTVLRRLGEALWRFVKDGVDDVAGRGARTLPRGPGVDRFDPRFSNVRVLSLEEVVAAARQVVDPVQRRLLCDQLLCSYELVGSLASMVPAIRCARDAGDVAALGAILAGRARVPCDDAEPRALFLLG